MIRGVPVWRSSVAVCSKGKTGGGETRQGSVCGVGGGEEDRAETLERGGAADAAAFSSRTESSETVLHHLHLLQIILNDPHFGCRGFSGGGRDEPEIFK